jgi:hypothetical protein
VADSYQSSALLLFHGAIMTDAGTLLMVEGIALAKGSTQTACATGPERFVR